MTLGVSPVGPAARCRARLTDPPGDRAGPPLLRSILRSYLVDNGCWFQACLYGTTAAFSTALRIPRIATTTLVLQEVVDLA